MHFGYLPGIYFGSELKAIKNAHIDSKIELIVKAREIDKCFR